MWGSTQGRSAVEDRWAQKGVGIAIVYGGMAENFADLLAKEVLPGRILQELMEVFRMVEVLEFIEPGDRTAISLEGALQLLGLPGQGLELAGVPRFPIHTNQVDASIGGRSQDHVLGAETVPRIQQEGWSDGRAVIANGDDLVEALGEDGINRIGKAFTEVLTDLLGAEAGEYRKSRLSCSGITVPDQRPNDGTVALHTLTRVQGFDPGFLNRRTREQQNCCIRMVIGMQHFVNKERIPQNPSQFHDNLIYLIV